MKCNTIGTDMAKSTGIILTAGALSFGNEWISANKVNWRIPVATLGVAFIFSGIEKLNEQAAVGLSVIVLITAMLTPFNGKSPVETLTSSLPNKGS